MRSITISGRAHDLAEGGAALAIVLWFIVAGWPVILGALLASPGVPLLKLALHRHLSPAVPLRKHLQDLAWELLIWGAGWLVVYRHHQGQVAEALGSLVLWYLVLYAFKWFTKWGAP